MKWFIAKTFTTLNPGTTYLQNWHIDAIAYQLEQVLAGRVKRLIIAMPPRSAKSISASIAFPAFVHGHDPTKEIMVASYAQNLSAKHQSDYRAVLGSDWFRRLFPGTLVDPMKETEQEVRLMQRGNRFATSVGGVVTGRGADIIIIDDPLKPDEARSEALRTKMNEWYSNTLLSRLNQKKEGAIVIVTQRLHIDDLIGYVTEYDDDWTVLELPAIAHEDQMIELGGERVHHRRKGDVLHPQREGRTELERLRRRLGSEVFEAQYQQRPVPPGGAMFKRAWLKSYDTRPAPGEDDIIFQSWDTASKTGLENDWSVGTTWLYQDGHYYLLDLVREKLNYPDLKAKMIDTARSFDPRFILIEDTGVGTGLIADLKSEGRDAIGVTPSQSKEARAQIQTPKFESGRVLFPKSAPWLSCLEAELLAFPAGRHDDQVDSITQALAHEHEAPMVVEWL